MNQISSQAVFDCTHPHFQLPLLGAEY